MARAMKAARAARGLTQHDVARRVGCTESQISKIETGRCRPAFEIRKRIAEALGINPWEVGT